MRSIAALALAAVALASAGGPDSALSEPIEAPLIEAPLIEAPLVEAGEATAPRLDRFQLARLAALEPQERAEEALQLAINRAAGAAAYVLGNAQQWRGQLERSQRLTALITAGINSPRIEVRMASFEVHLAQYDLGKTAEDVDRLVGRYLDDPEGAGPWALWSIGVIGARGGDRLRVFDELRLATTHESVRLRRWAVDGLGKLGGVAVIEPLLVIARTDPSPQIRERALCALAHGATLHIAERYEALPGLLALLEQPRVADDTRGWGYQALREISGLRGLPDDPWVWHQQLLAVGLLDADRQQGSPEHGSR